MKGKGQDLIANSPQNKRNEQKKTKNRREGKKRES